MSEREEMEEIQDTENYSSLENILVEKYPKVTLRGDSLISTHISHSSSTSTSSSSSSSSSTPGSRRQRRNRMSARFKTQPITFTEIKEVDEETPGPNNESKTFNFNFTECSSNPNVSPTIKAPNSENDGTLDSLTARISRRNRRVNQAESGSSVRPLSAIQTQLDRGSAQSDFLKP
jgi:hypothetical protein